MISGDICCESMQRQGVTAEIRTKCQPEKERSFSKTIHCPVAT
jgi:hypothetical protein